MIRPIRPEDEPQHRAFIEQLRPEDLRLRFFSVRRELPRSELGVARAVTALSEGFELDEAGSDVDALRFVLELAQLPGESP